LSDRKNRRIPKTQKQQQPEQLSDGANLNEAVMEMESEQGWGNSGILVVVLLDGRPHDILGVRTVGVVESDLQPLAMNKGTSQQNQSSEQKEKSRHF